MVEQAEQTYLLNKKVKLLQPVQGFRTSIDSVLLTAACHITDNQRVLDMGCGVGAIGLCLLHRYPNIHVTGIELEHPYITLAKENTIINNVSDRFTLIHGDVCTFNVPDKDDRFDHVVTNPPYYGAQSHLSSPNLLKASAMSGANILETWIQKAFEILQPKGTLTIINPAENLSAIIQALGKKFGAIDIIPLWPRKNQNAKRVIVRAIKNRKTPPSIYPGLILHNENGEYTKEANDILRDGKMLDYKC